MKARKLMSALLAVLMMLSIGVTGVNAAEDKLPFSDVIEGEWYYDAVAYTYGAGLMNGTGDGSKFSPAMTLTRGMVVTVLYRNDGSPEGNYPLKFSDVAEGQYYATAVAWAHKYGIVNGTGEDDWGDPLFSPDKNITRQELATMFARYADYKHVDTTANTAELSAFPDAGKVASWASDTFKWAAGTGIITGKGTGSAATLSPEDSASRAEFAIIIQRFNEKNAARVFTYKLAYEMPVIENKFLTHEYEGVTEADVYVAVDGNDNNPGTKEKPLATFEAAKAKIKTVKKSGERVVAFMAGDYGRLHVSLTAEDAGTAESPIKYCAYGDGEVIFNNGVIVPEESFKPISDSEKALFGDDVDTSMIKKADLTGKVDKFTSRMTLFNGSSTLHEARFPNMNDDGTDKYYSNLTTTVDPMSSIKLQGPLKDIVNGFKTTKGMKISGYLRTGWLVDTFPVKSWDGDESIITFDFENCTFDNGYKLDQFVLMEEGRTTDLVFFHNLADQLDVKGEYWFDEETKQLYVYDVSGEYAISQYGAILGLVNCDYVTISGFSFFGATDTTVSATTSDHVTVSDCTFAYISGNSCLYSWGSDYITFEYNEAYNFICGGIMTNEGGDRNTLEESHNVVRNNYVHDFGHPSYFSSAGGIILWNSVGAIAEHNILENGVHGGIVFGGDVDCIIRYNVLDNMVYNTKDYGAIYGGGVGHRGNKIYGNLIMNMDCLREAYGIYIDECGSGHEVYGNIFYNGGGHAVTLNGGRENNISENIIINTEHGDFLMNNAGMYELIISGTESDYVNHYSYARLLEERAAEGTPGYEAWVNRFPELYNFNVDHTKVGDPDCLFTTINFVKNNTVIGSELKYGETYDMFAVKEGNVAYGLDKNDLFVDPTHGDYTFKEGKNYIGFDFDKLGVQ